MHNICTCILHSITDHVWIIARVSSKATLCDVQLLYDMKSHLELKILTDRCANHNRFVDQLMLEANTAVFLLLAIVKCRASPHALMCEGIVILFTQWRMIKDLMHEVTLYALLLQEVGKLLYLIDNRLEIAISAV